MRVDLGEYRQQIDEIDGELLSLFVRRMEVSEQIAAYKKAHDLPVRDRAREEEKLGAIRDRLPAELRAYGSSLFSLLMELSRARQEAYHNNRTKEDEA